MVSDFSPLPPEQNAEFVAAMEDILDVYTLETDEKRPLVCMDECPKQLIGETRIPIPAKLGETERFDTEYVRNGVCEIFMFTAPLDIMSVPAQLKAVIRPFYKDAANKPVCGGMNGVLNIC